MFTGLIRGIGTLQSVRKTGESVQMDIRHPFKDEFSPGASVSVMGVCLTVTRSKNMLFTAECYYSTLKKTKLGCMKTGDKVHLEPTLRVGDSIDGHYVQGHVTAFFKVLTAKKRGAGKELRIHLPEKFRSDLIPEGSIAIDGVSLTIADLGETYFSIQLIGKTLQDTVLGSLKPGDIVNVETDMLHRRNKAVETPVQKPSILTMKKLEKWGYT